MKALVWFNSDAKGMDWTIETSPEAQEAFASGIASSYYAANDFASLSVSPIPPLEQLNRQRRLSVLTFWLDETGQNTD